ncbi:hypothetical protein EC845_1337 [Comamonas sp. BIGb0124]|uniref:hypothetical protein n=1 Tax=Comamonas sp. BIGb0124 TaxID=2485130 RepID=UPI000F48AB6D|nr:hypothetical protein [Comamonas sp. BIGb0124]ROR22441.1 hypothetical protein EC845_1337 [Comamonas sp. BIGb0124]
MSSPPPTPTTPDFPQPQREPPVEVPIDPGENTPPQRDIDPADPPIDPIRDPGRTTPVGEPLHLTSHNPTQQAQAQAQANAGHADAPVPGQPAIDDDDDDKSNDETEDDPDDNPGRDQGRDNERHRTQDVPPSEGVPPVIPHEDPVGEPKQ